jgi:hypothetical protein
LIDTATGIVDPFFLRAGDKKLGIVAKKADQDLLG